MKEKDASGRVTKREREFWERHEAFEWLTEDSVREVLSGIPKASGDLLELCAGSGMFTRQFSTTAHSYTCLDLSATLLERLALAVPGVRPVLGDALAPDFPDESFDYVCVFAGLHHLPDIEKAVRSAYRLLRPSGKFVCFEPNDKCWYRQPMKVLKPIIGFYSDDEVFLNPDTISGTLLNAGFGGIHQSYSTPRYADDFLQHPLNRALARMVYLCGGVSKSPYWQAFFTISATKL